MFGLDFSSFQNNTDLGLRPLLLPDGFEGTPLRKSFVLAARASKPWPGAKEPGVSDAGTSPSRRKMLPPGVPDQQWGPRDEWGGRDARAGGRRAGRLPGAAAAGRADGAQGDGAHAGPARADVRRRLP